MKAEINNENKASFFALYWGKEVWCNSYYNELSVNPETFHPAHLESKAYLKLKPLSSISDEDAKKLLYDSASKFKRASNARLHIDELRAMGYAMDWHGLTVDEMVDARWIKLVEK